MKKDVWNEEQQDFYLHRFRNIVRTEDNNYELQPVYKLVGDEILETEENKNNPTNAWSKNCYICIYHDTCDNCLMRAKLENIPEGYMIFDHWQNKCDAYTPIDALTIIHNKKEMIQFIENTEYFFSCPEDYESYFGFERKWNEETGKILESVRGYYNRGGGFKNIPDKYPVVLYFPYVDVSNNDYKHTDLQWIYIGMNR